ncbi:Hypothetical Protein FCC1311_101712 [Hondaea fermentalgiana]|uniref:Uncharacterized protein n=1 Tax=Hondaea fermentalgiana TaxID=2315210 RepID=A0A2R5GW06_9STRA|nr:Hypothetical Protein FCC1311_101712 [Hondaea fermentalgiana]|eukprot:GBG33948.1 Hypothetical Protein FCC1311_101712 [Hondaea fermentalgiana]
MTARQVSRGTSGLSEWDVVSEGALSQERYSTGSLTSDESDAVVIFGGRGAQANMSPNSLSFRESASTMADMGPNSGVLNQYLLDADDDDAKMGQLQRHASGEGNRPWQQKHQRLLSAVSDLASDPGLNRVNASLFGGIEQSMPIEQRLLDQIAKLAEDLDESQEQTKVLLLQNDRLMTQNESLKKQLQESLSQASRRLPRGAAGITDDSEESPDRMRVTLAVAAGFLIIGLAKKRLLMNSFGLLGAAISCVGFLHFVQNTGEPTKRDHRNL